MIIFKELLSILTFYTAIGTQVIGRRIQFFMFQDCDHIHIYENDYIFNVKNS
ncbi:hypothetical protein SC1083_2194 [Aggregatibacter actinomycetemcomitans serotype e str. SC1083]|uniref:Uncharacterized protein n=1 Tax=Aggregatibacter actinomycetemcomitans serotype e str. SC1083 TaxID=907488 RepID=G4ABF9_AGGAC|nr:hypothetical protein SC1083_2194 [Aggregatibacter actinomycetemcomitans serotype e str. SC1083]KYK73726.1 hypothetical protein SA3096_07145 [Aggregatibacter actinomycetemcomitans serotype e str. SA3096]KYK77313.1 hypothetical protein SC936_11130 [Aggregatibacter actinomycetemcomitans serotype e str. SC936]